MFHKLLSGQRVVPVFEDGHWGVATLPFPALLVRRVGFGTAWAAAT